MADDIVFRLKSTGRLGGSTTGELIMHAAHEIEQLRAHVNELEQAIEEYKFRLHWLNEELLKRGGT